MKEGGVSRPSRFTVEEMFGAYEQGKRLGRTDANVVGRFCEVFGKRVVNEVGVDELHRWARKRGIGDDTWRRELNVWGAAMNAARKQGWPVPEVDLRKPPPGDGRVRWASEEEKERVLGVVRARKYRQLEGLVKFLLVTGARVGEALALEWKDVEEASVVLATRKKRFGRLARRRVPLVGEAREVIEKAGRFKSVTKGPFPWDYETLRRQWVRCCKEAGVEDLRFHDLRHTFASEMLRAGTSPKVVADILGHSTIELIDRYGHLVPGDLEKALERVFVGGENGKVA